MPIDDPLQVRLNALKLDGGATESLRDVSIRAVVNAAIPIFGNVITALLSDLADRRWKQRVELLIEEMMSQLKQVEAEKVPEPQYFQSEEFQALIIEAIDQQRTNRFVEKRKMLAVGLARSGFSPYADEADKEVFFRLMRDLSIEDIDVLRQLPSDKFGQTLDFVPRGTLNLKTDKRQLMAVSNRLQGFGLAYSRFQLQPPSSGSISAITSERDVHRVISEFVDKAPKQLFIRSDFGDRFLAYLSESIIEEEKQSTEPQPHTS